MLRDRISKSMKEAMKAKEAKRLSTLRLINAAIKDREIALRTDDASEGMTDEEVLTILAKMVKQRLESARIYEEAAQLELAEQERSEITVIEEFLPRQLTEAEIASVVDAAVEETGATSIRDMGKVMGLLKTQYKGRMDFGAVGALLKKRLG